MNAEAHSTNFDDLQEVSSKYKTLKEQVAAQSPAEAPPNATPAEPAPASPKPAKARERPSRRARTERRRRQEAQELEMEEKEPPTEHVPTIEELKDLERFKLTVWVAKLVMLSMTGILATVIILYAYTAYVTKTVPDMGLFGSLFGHLKEVMVIIIEAQKVGS